METSKENNSQSGNQINIGGNNNNLTGATFNQQINKKSLNEAVDSPSSLDEKVKSGITKLIQENKIEAALGMIQTLPELESDLSQAVVLNLRRLAELRMANINNTLNEEQQRLEISKIADSALKILNKI